MLALNLVVRAVIVDEGRLLVTHLNDGVRAPFYSLLGGHLDLGETLTQCVQREVREEVGISVAPSRLLYIVENFFYRGTRKLHEVGFYFLCHPVVPGEGGLLGRLTVNTSELISPELLHPDELATAELQPRTLRDAIRADMLAGWPDTPRLIVVNELPGDVHTTAGTFGL